MDPVLLVSALGLCTLGTLAILSATRSPESPSGLLSARLAHLAGGMVLLGVCAALPLETFRRVAKGLYGLSLALLLLVDLAGHERLGAQRWLQLGPLSFQPSELAKLSVILLLSDALARQTTPPRTLGAVMGRCLWVLPALVLVFLQPDLGTTLVFLAIVLGMLFAVGTPLRTLAGLVGMGLAVMPVVWRWLKPYQQKRLLVFLDPSLDPLGAGYHLIQSKIAIGSGQVWGKGLFQGTQNTLQFLPMQHTDFVFAVIGEELGFVGAIGVLGLFWVYLIRGLQAAQRAPDAFGRLVGVGIVAMVGFHVLVNVGMTVGVMPVTGIPLPFLSYGGSALLANLAATGILLNLGRRRGWSGP
ncbi:MAG: rod shape-determining protein RodA [Armatimonadetes bacterium]|nr:rod shape-determining protein RodA [Armatimonadota bacterium]MDW8153009.1 rod shape-determining protein RodA [Armatimonadota bacterium]